VTHNNTHVSLIFFVTTGNYGNLLSYESSEPLGILNKINSIKLNDNSADKSLATKLAKQYPSAFSGKIGLLKNQVIQLHIDKSIIPVQQKLRHVPFHIRDLVAKEIKQMLDNDIIEPVNGPTLWVSPIVPVPKPNRPGEIRICSDAKAANQAIMRARHTTPTLDDLVVKLDGMAYVSKFDLKSGYNQLLIDEKCRYITAFCTHLGIFQYKRLNFGINTAAEIFQKSIEQVIAGIDGVLNTSDDIIVFGKTKVEHDENLNAVLNRIEKSGLTVNTSKCEFAKTELNFFGLHFSKNGVSIEKSKRDALLNARPPKTASEVRSFLGLAHYCYRFRAA
jgi:hypothetical protein